MKGNLWLKLASVFLAVIVWFSVITKVQSSVTMEAQVEFSDIPAGLEVLEPPPHVAVSVRGPERLVRNLDSSGVRVTLDMAKAQRGRHIYNIDDRAVALPAFMRLMDVSPSSITVTLEEIARKTVPVRAFVTGVTREGYRVASIEVSPSEAAVDGAASKVRKTSSLSTEPIDITNASDTILTDAATVPDEGVRTEVDKVRVKVVIKEKGK